jgi:hypothetical protein
MDQKKNMTPVYTCRYLCYGRNKICYKSVTKGCFSSVTKGCFSGPFPKRFFGIFKGLKRGCFKGLKRGCFKGLKRRYSALLYSAQNKEFKS